MADIHFAQPTRDEGVSETSPACYDELVKQTAKYEKVMRKTRAVIDRCRAKGQDWATAERSQKLADALLELDAAYQPYREKLIAVEKMRHELGAAQCEYDKAHGVDHGSPQDLMKMLLFGALTNRSSGHKRSRDEEEEPTEASEKRPVKKH